MTDIFPGDTVRCLVGYYKSYGYGELAIVKRLDISSAGNPVLILTNDLCDYGESMYSLDNWQFHSRPEPKKEKTMSYVRTQYFAAKIDNSVEGVTFLPMAISTGDVGEPFNEQTVLRSSKAEVLKDIRANIKDGEQWVILQTQGFVTPAEPKPVLKDVQITECR